jgi:pSer/pThr/pTyr-binding forkhead associated (FHA) protein
VVEERNVYGNTAGPRPNDCQLDVHEIILVTNNSQAYLIGTDYQPRGSGNSVETKPVNDPYLTRFAEVCGATSPMNLRIDLADGETLAEGSIPMPFVLVGRDDACDVTLADAEVNPRHAWFQVVAGRIYAIDLGSRTGLLWSNGASGSGWLDEPSPVRIGPFRICLCSPVSDKPAFPTGYNPLQSDAAGSRNRPKVALEFRNGKRPKDRWAVNRYITLIGKASECKIHLTGDDIANYHCGLVLTSGGLWVVDLSGRGVVVNGERMRVSPLGHGAELWVGRFLIGVQCPETPHPTGSSRSGILSAISPRSGVQLGSGSHSTTRNPNLPTRKQGLPAEDEVALGAAPTDAPASNSQVFGESFRMRVSTLGTNGPASQRINVSDTLGLKPASSVIARPAPRPIMPEPMLDLFSTLTPGTAQRAIPEPVPLASSAEPLNEPSIRLVRQLSELHSQLFSQFQQSLAVLVQLFGTLRRDQFVQVEEELSRIEQLNKELAQLQTEVARRAVETYTAPPPEAADGIPMASPMPDLQASGVPSLDSIALYSWVTDRMAALQKERQARWSALADVVGTKPSYLS